MKKNNSKLRNSLTVRVNDTDQDAFLKKAGRNYSTVLRKLIKEYINEPRPMDKNND